MKSHGSRQHPSSGQPGRRPIHRFGPARVPTKVIGIWLSGAKQLFPRMVPLLIYPGRIPKFNRDLKRAVPKTHLRNQSPNNS